MQQLHSTCPPFAFQTATDQFKSSADPIPPIQLNRNPLDYMKNQQTSPEDHSLKKRLQIFKQYKIKSKTVSENDDTVVYNKRRRYADSGKAKEGFATVCQRQFQQCKKLHLYDSGVGLGEQSSKKRQKIFSIFKPTRIPKYQLSIKSMQQGHQEQLITTQRFRNNIQKLLPVTQQPGRKLFSLFSAKTENMSIININNVYSRTPSLQKFDMCNQNTQNPAFQNQQKHQIQTNQLSSPKKITFTYQNPPPFVGFQQITLQTNSNSNLSGSQKLMTKKAQKNEEISLPRSVVDRPALQFKQSTLKLRSYNYKKTVDFVDKSWNIRSKTNNFSKFTSWGNKIRTQLMGVKGEFQQKSLKGRDFDSSKVSLNLVKQSLIINGQKIAKENLKINQSLSNISDGLSSKRYFDEDIDFLPQVKKISYNNIDISRQQSFPDQGDFRPNQLLLEFQNHKFQSKNQEILRNSDLLPAEKSPVKNYAKQEPTVQKNILQQLSQDIKPQKLIKQSNKAGKLFPVVLVLSATLLFVIQAIF